MGNWQWLLDLPVAVLLAATLLRARRLDRALTALRDDRGALDALLGGFDGSAQHARAAIETLRELTEGAGRRLEQQTAAALTLRDDLGLLVEQGEGVSERLDHGLRAERRRQSQVPAASTASTASPRPASSSVAVPAGAEMLRVRSKAERDLLVALQAGR